MSDTMPVIMNLNADNTVNCVECFDKLDSLLFETININSGRSAWTPPDKTLWREFKISSYNKNILFYKPELLITNKQDDTLYHFYITSDKDDTNVSISLCTTGNIIIEHSHFGNICLLTGLIILSLIECGISEDNVTREGNYILLNGKRISRGYYIIKNGYVYEKVILNINYDDSVIRSILPENVYSTYWNLNTTGLINESPIFNIDNFYSILTNKVTTNVQEYIEIDTTCMELGFNDLIEEITNRMLYYKKTNIIDTLNRSDITQKLNDFIANEVDFRYIIVNDYRINKEIGLPNSITENEYKEKLQEMENLREYIDTQKEFIITTVNQEGLDNLVISYQDFLTYVEYKNLLLL